jgi:hypothetical protein
MTFLLPVIAILLITTALTASRLTQKAPKVKRKEDTAEKPEPSALYQGFKGPIDPLLLSRIKNSYGEATAILVNKHHENNRGAKTAKKSQTPRNNRTNIPNTGDEDSYTFLCDLDSALAAGYDLNYNPLSHSGTGSGQDHSDIGSSHGHSCHDSSHSHSSHDHGSSHDYGSHDCGGHDFGGFD